MNKTIAKVVCTFPDDPWNEVFESARNENERLFVLDRMLLLHLRNPSIDYRVIRVDTKRKIVTIEAE